MGATRPASGNKAVAEMRCKKRKHKWGRRVPRREIKLLHKRIHRGGTPRPHLCLLSYALMSLCLPRQRLPDHATASALMFLEATRTLVRGRQPRSGLVCILCKLMFLCFRGKRQARTSYLMSLCPYVLLSPALAAARPHYNHLTERCKFRPFLPRLRSRR